MVFESRINYSQAISQAGSVRGYADRLNREISELQQLVNDVSANWKGPASESYQKKLRALIRELEDTRTKMRALADSITQAANDIRREDQQRYERMMQAQGS